KDKGTLSPCARSTNCWTCDSEPVASIKATPQLDSSVHFNEILMPDDRWNNACVRPFFSTDCTAPNFVKPLKIDAALFPETRKFRSPTVSCLRLRLPVIETRVTDGIERRNASMLAAISSTFHRSCLGRSSRPCRM